MQSTQVIGRTRRVGLAAAVALGVASAWLIGPAAAASAPPKTVSQCKKKYAHNAKARTACIKRVQKAHQPSSGGKCSLETSESETAGGEKGDTKDFTVTVKFTGTPGQYQVEVAIHNPKVNICSATITVLDPSVIEHNGAESFYKEVTYPVTISSRGVARPVTVPANSAAPKVRVYGRLG